MLAHLIGITLRCARIAPPGFAWWVGGQLGFAFGCLPGREQQRCREHLAIAYPEHSPAWHRRTSRKVFRHLGRMGLWTLSQLHREPRDLFRGMVIEGRENLRAAIDATRRGQGIIGVGAHFGNWELLARTTGWFMPLTLLGRRMRNPAIDDLVRSMRKINPDSDVVYQDTDIRQILRHIRNGRMLATLPDQDVGRLAGCFIPWFGQLAYTPIGPAALAQMARVPMLPLFCYHHGGRWVMRAGQPIPVPKGSDRQQEQVLATAQFTAQLERLVRRHPEQWVWFHRRWRRRPADRPDAPVLTGW